LRVSGTSPREPCQVSKNWERTFGFWGRCGWL